jgi:hypothetical protein
LRDRDVDGKGILKGEIKYEVRNRFNWLRIVFNVELL